jgi:8-oxo-dGTP diphosphatase
LADVKTGVAALVVREGRYLFGKRLGAHGAGTWSLPGGKPDADESLEECALRELYEETGLVGHGTSLVAETFDEFPADDGGLTYATHYLLVAEVSGEPRVVEPAKCGGWEWFGWDELPAPLFLPIVNLLKQGFDPRR